MSELDYKESWVPKNWCSWTVVLEKTLESPLDYKEIQHISIKEETLGQRIRAQRIRLGMTQEELAKATFIPKPTISNYENDRIDIKSSVIAELAKALETDPNYLILGEKAPEVANGFMNEAEGLFSKITDPKVQPKGDRI